MTIKQRFNNLGIEIPKILLPSGDIDYKKWAVIACDQYTSDFDYWREVEEFVGEAPSTLHLMYPECYLEENGGASRIAKINASMREYMQNRILLEQSPAFYLIRRETPFSPARHGLLLALDLEKYDYEKGPKSVIRATESTIVERIPPRKRIREKAPLEMPHILTLIDDPERSIIEPLSLETRNFEKMYQFELMKNGGSITSFKISGEKYLEQILSAFEKLADPESQKNRYNLDNTFLFAVGDGNHSLATAKAVWEDIKKNIDNLDRHPARYALVEMCNIHDNGIIFEPIHRAIFRTSLTRFRKLIEDDETMEFEEKRSLDEIINAVKNEGRHVSGIISIDFKGILHFHKPKRGTVSGSVDDLITKIIRDDKEAKIDYIHGDSPACKIGSEPGNIGFILPPIDKNDFFKTIIKDGTLPRKTFSMGEADEKRFYIETRKIVQD